MTDTDPETHDVAVAVQGALDAVTRLHREREITDLTALLRQELSRRGAEVDDEAWLAEAVRHLREGHPVVVDEADPGQGERAGL